MKETEGMRYLEEGGGVTAAKKRSFTRTGWSVAWEQGIANR